ncbi:enoyl-CoA hydratase/isomerase family protein [Alcaligenaceae bacterium]|nr:enoyl-CoA hydratase/isomerase family protein [Alcaligenaceae bacterium]
MSIVTTIEDGVATVMINQPQRKNALSAEMREQLVGSMKDLAENDDVRTVILTGAGNAFCAGSDATGMGGRDAIASRKRLRSLQRSVLSIYALEKPVIAAVNGACVGVGWSLALACDHIIASDTAFFSQIFGRMGLAPDGGSAWFLMQNIGVLRAKDLVYSCRRLPSHEALDWGLVNCVVPASELLSEATKRARELSQGPSMAIGLSKSMLHLAAAPNLEAFLESELLIQTQLTQSDDYREGVAAFRESRKPVFTGG